MIENHKSLAETFLKKGVWLYLFSFIIGPVNYVIKIIITWELTVSEVWILYGIISLITLLSAYNDFWMAESLKHFIPKYVTEKKYNKVKSILFYAFFIQIFTSLLIAGFFFFWADIIANSYFKTPEASEILKIFAFFFIGINIFQTISNFYMAVQDTFYQKITDFIRVLFICASVLFVYFWDLSSLVNFSYTWIVWLYIWTLISLFLFYKKYYKSYFENEKILFDKKLIKKISSYALLVFAWASAGTLLSQIDMQMIIYILGTVDAWYYTAYLSIIGIPFMIIWPIFWFLFPLFSQMYAKWEIKKIRLVKWVFQKNFIAISLAFNILFFVISEILAYVLFWEKFIQSWVILKYSILLLMFNFLLQINFNIMAWVWKVKDRVKIISIALVFNFTMNIVLIKSIWVEWAALATSFGWILIWILSEVFLWKKYRVSFDFVFFFKNMILMWLFWFFLYYFINPFFEWLSRWFSFALLSIVWIIWFIMFWLINKNELRKFYLEIKK